jgi:hypothetical protein
MDYKSIPAATLAEIEFKLSLLHVCSPGDTPRRQVAELEELLANRAPGTSANPDRR